MCSSDLLTPFVNEEQRAMMIERLKTQFNQDEDAQVECRIDFSDQENGKVMFSARGFADVVKDEIVYELKFVSELTHEHFLQCACYMAAMDLQKGILWNMRDNTSYEIEIPEKKAFLDAVARAVTKGAFESYYGPAQKQPDSVSHPFLNNTEGNARERFAEIDTAASWDDKAMSAGAAVSDAETKEVMGVRKKKKGLISRLFQR